MRSRNRMAAGLMALRQIGRQQRGSSRGRRPLLAVTVLLGFALAAASAPSPATGLGGISGAVLDELSRPLPGATVTAVPVGVALGAALPQARTDARGRFTIGRLHWGRYIVSAAKPSAGYPFLYWGIYGTRGEAEVSLSSKAPTARLRLRVGPKAGILFGTVEDSSNSAPIKDAVVRIKVAGEINSWVDMSIPATFRLLLPPDVVATLTFRARGFRPISAQFRMRPGQREHYIARLAPASP